MWLSWSCFLHPQATPYNFKHITFSRYFLGIPWENWIQTSFLNPSPNSRKVSWFFLRNSGIICLVNFTVATDCLACLELVLHFCSLFLLTNCSHRQSGANQSFLMFRGVTRSQGREGSSVNYSLTAPSTISPVSSLHFWCANTEVGIIFKTRDEQNPSIYPSDRSKLNSSRILAQLSVVVLIIGLGGDPDRLQNASIHYPSMKIYAGSMDMSVGNFFSEKT